MTINEKTIAAVRPLDQADHGKSKETMGQYCQSLYIPWEIMGVPDAHTDRRDHREI